MTVCNSTPLMMCMVLVILGMVNVAGAKDDDPAAGGNRLVARDDHEVSPSLLPPLIMQQRFCAIFGAKTLAFLEHAAPLSSAGFATGKGDGGSRGE